jgi:hypothetical protein
MGIVAADVHVDALFDRLVIGYSNPFYVGDQVFDVVGTQENKNSGVYAVWDKHHFFQNRVAKRALGQAAPILSLDVSTTQYKCIPRHVRAALDPDITDNADAAFRLQQRYTEVVDDQLSLDREEEVATACTTYTNWTTYNTLSGADQWDVYTTSDPIDDMDYTRSAIRDLIGRYPNVCVFGPSPWRHFRRHPDIIRACFGPGSSESQIVTAARVAEFFEFDRVLLGMAFHVDQSTGLTGTTDNALGTYTYSNIWGNFVWMGYVEMGSEGVKPTAGVTFRQYKKMRGYADVETETEFIEGKESRICKVTAADAGGLIISPVSA